ncbi:hypothetical protein EXIGLDRAFT_755592 [Exidia glandulosa HHB12029]|uniref:F-box domain-containing protein n=1 Tax=Exidia glandulosa HHB12029 TaxID=1314781 RepID=A0A165BXM4_EXIGL|nr:hypothetical protein EXIGLDRAFT_755592 [Exidia glandulosa HHB12029]
MKLPAGVAFRLFEHLDESTRHALVRAYPVLALAHAQFRARRSAWQARVPVELLRDILAYLPPADFYTACCVSAFWRECGTSDVQLLKDQLELVRANSWTSNYDLGLLDYVDEDESAKLWLYFVVAAPRRYMFGDGMRRYRVTTLDVRRAVGTPRRGIFMSDYGGIIALSTSKGLVFYSVEELLPNSPDLTPSGVDLGTLIHPRGVLYFQLRDVRIAHQQGTPGTFHVFAVYDGGSVFRASMELSVIPETHLKQATFTRFTLVYGGPPSASPVACDWSGAPPPAASFQPLNIAVVAPASPARALLSLSSAEEKHFALVRANDTSSAHPGLPVLRSKRSRMALDFLLRKSRASSPNTKPWDLLALAFPDVASTDWRAMQFDRLAIKEVYLEWLHAHTGRTPVLKSTDVVTGSHLVFEGLTPMTATLSHKGIKYSALAPLQAPLGLESVLPSAYALKVLRSHGIWASVRGTEPVLQ